MFLKQFAKTFLNIICPPVCPICGEAVDEPHCLCQKCYQKLHFITKPCCSVCGRPFEYQGLENMICATCMKKAPSFSMARSALEYDDFSKQLVLAFKHGDRTELTPLFVKFLMQADPEIFQNVDLIMPVPLHWTRRLKRKYNQSALLGKALGRKMGLPYSEKYLKRVRRTESQGKKKQKERQKNVKNAFLTIHSDQIRGKTVLLVDDVMTTGATLNECAKVLKKEGVKDIKVITLYRVITL